MHRVARFAPISIQEGSGSVIYGEDPEQKINTVCHTCNNTWMSQLEEKNVSRLKPMLFSQPVTLDAGGIRLLTEWTVKTAMVSDSIKPRNDNENFFTRPERVAMREHRTIPERTRVWVGALQNSDPKLLHIGCHGMDYTIMIDGGKTRAGTGSVSTIYTGHFVVQTVTEHTHTPAAADARDYITPPRGVSDERLVEIYPGKPKSVNWPPTPFTEWGPTSILFLMERWRMGEQVSKIKNA